MKKRIISIMFSALICLALFPLSAAAASPTVSAGYSGGVVTVSGTGFPHDAAYTIRAVNTATSTLAAMGQTTADVNGRISASITTGALPAPSEYAVYVNNQDGSLAAQARITSNEGGNHGGGDSGGGGGSNSGTPTVIPPVSTPSENTFVSDTNTDFNVSGTYQFKIASKNGAVPNLVVGTSGVFITQLVKVSGSDYYIKLTAIGQPGAKAGIYVNGVKLLVATVGSMVSLVKSDTTVPFKVAKGKSYVFKLTADKQPAFGSGNSSVFQAVFFKAVGKDYYYRVTAVGKPEQAAGFYINSGKTPVAVATIA